MSSPSTTEQVRVRMYRHGLGDCFLLRFSGASEKPYFIVIDSGVLKGTSQPATRMREVAEDIERETGGRIDVLVVTHEHWDHVSGFSEAREVWQRMHIEEIWLAWTEDTTNKLAAKLRDDRNQRKAKIQTQIKALAGSSAFYLDSERGSRIDALLGFMGLGLGAAAEGDVGGTKEALDFIQARAANQHFHNPGTCFCRAALPGVRIFVLGPPQDEKKLKRSDPSKAHPEVYSDPGQAFAFSGKDDGAEDDFERCFEADIGKVVGTGAEYARAFKKFFPSLLKDGSDPAWRRLNFESTAELEQLAIALDGDTNNSSLALAFELPDGRVLLFPADAQVGNWLSWHDHIWDADSKPIRADDLLARTVLYKVGHHGSHNATLKADGLEKMTHRDLVAIIPVNKAMAAKKHWKMPFSPLYARLLEKARGRVILSDAMETLPKAEALAGLTATERKRFEEMVTASELFIDLSF